MSFCFYPRHEHGCPHIRHCPHLGEATLGLVVLAANENKETRELLWRLLDAERVGAAPLAAFTYTYDDAGTRTSMVEIGPITHTWGYDNAYRLTSEVRNPSTPTTITHAYDDVGNRTSSQATTFSYAEANQLKTSTLGGSRTTYVYDANGNLRTTETVNGGVNTYTWDDENRQHIQ